MLALKIGRRQPQVKACWKPPEGEKSKEWTPQLETPAGL